MRYILLLPFFFLAFHLSAQSDSLTVMVPTLSGDTIMSDSIRDEHSVTSVQVEGDTIIVEDYNSSWSLIPEDTIPAVSIVHRKDSGMVLLSAKIGFSESADELEWDGYSTNEFPPVAIQIEYFHNDYLSYGAQLVYTRNKYTNDTLTSNFTKKSIVGMAALGTFHYGSWLQDITHDKINFGYLDLYFTMALRLDVYRDVQGGPWNEDTQQFDVDIKNKDTSAKLRFRPIFGARYFISDRFSINMEFGRGNLGLITTSVSWLINNPADTDFFKTKIISK